MKSVRQFAPILVVATLLAFSGCADVLGTGTDSTPTFAPSETDVPTTTAPADDTYAMGEVVELTQRNTTLAVSVEDYRFADEYEAQNASDGGTHTVAAPDGQRYLFVKVRVENVGDEHGAGATVAVEPVEDNSLVGDTPTWLDEGWYRSVRGLPAGETQTGWLRVVVDEDVTASDVRVGFSPDILLTEDEYRWTLQEEA